MTGTSAFPVASIAPLRARRSSTVSTPFFSHTGSADTASREKGPSCSLSANTPPRMTGVATGPVMSKSILASPASSAGGWSHALRTLRSKFPASTERSAMPSAVTLPPKVISVSPWVAFISTSAWWRATWRSAFMPSVR